MAGKFIELHKDAASIQGVNVSSTAPTDGQALVYDSDANEYVPGTVAAEGGAGGYPPDYASLTGSNFSGPVTASLGLSASFLQVGTANVASSGDMRVAGGFTLKSNVNGVDRPVLQASVGAEVIIGGFGVNECAGVINRATSGGIYNQIGGTNYLTVLSTGISAGAPLNFAIGTPSTNGHINLPSSSPGIYSVASVAATNMRWIGSFGNDLHIGANHGGTDKVPGDIYTWAAGSVIKRAATFKVQDATGATDRLSIGATAATFSVPVTASLGVSASFVQVGTSTPATTGDLRLPSLSTALFRNAANNANLHIWKVDASNNIWFGSDESQANSAPQVGFYPSSQVAFGIGGSTKMYITTAGMGVYNTTNLLLYGNGGTAPGAGGGAGVFAIGNAGTMPTSTPSAGAVMYASGGLIKYRSSNGSIYTAAGMDYDPTGAGTLSIVHSGSVVTAFDASSRVYDAKGKVQTTNTTPTTIYTFMSGANGRAYSVDALINCRATATTGTMSTKLSGHFYNLSGTMTMVEPVDVGMLKRNNNALTASLDAQSNNLVLTVTGPSATYNWFATVRVQEVG